MTRKRFLDQIDQLKNAGYRFVDEDEFLLAISGRAPTNDKRLLLTFDDAYEELFNVYLEHLRPREVPILVFIVSSYVGRENTWDLTGGRRRFKHLSWDQIKAMAKAGARFGSHGATHADLTTLDARSLDVEIARSKTDIESALGVTARSFSYPFGRYDQRVKTAVESAGYEAAFSLYPKHCNEIVDRFALRRNGVYIIDTPRTIRWKLERSPVYWFEEMKCRTINGIAVLTPVIKRVSPGRGSSPGPGT
ncbi:MAG: polysaccharide deacetylase family protein [Candidatus Latescibacterota bacterium]|nr:MAG: polysaccharide deacetylase family protein [Candidatus Latescibacterota bacterium]